MITNPNFLIPKSMEPDFFYLWYFKLCIMIGQMIKVWNISKVYKLHHRPSGFKDVWIKKYDLWSFHIYISNITKYNQQNIFIIITL